MKISAKEQLLSQLIAVPNYKYVIKAYQRPYSINKQTGSVIDRKLVDGQQRLTTTMILFCAIRDLLETKKRGLGKALYIEHIFPQTLSKEWKEVLHEKGKEAETYTYKCGNLTLLSGKKNSKIQNALYEKKCESYLKSDIPMTKALPSQYKSWNYEAVNQRTEELAKRAVQVWKIF